MGQDEEGDLVTDKHRKEKRADKKDKKHRHKERDEASRHREQDPDRDRDRERERREREKERERRERDAERERQRQREPDARDRRRSRSRDREAGVGLRVRGPRSQSRDRPDREPAERDRTREASKRDREGDRDDEHKDKRRRRDVESAASRAEREQKEKDAEQAALDDEAERRRKRVEAWRAEQARKKAEQEAAEAAKEEAAQQQKQWNFDDDEDDEEDGDEVVQPLHNAGEEKPMEVDAADDEDEVDPLDAFMAENNAGIATATSRPSAAAAAEDEEVDPLDAFMAKEVMPAVKQQPVKSEPQSTSAGASNQNQLKLKIKLKPEANGNSAAAEGVTGETPAAPAQPARQRRRRNYYDSDSSSDGDEKASEDEDDLEWAKAVQAGKLSKADRLGPVDHSKMTYPPFRRNFYIEVPELARMREEDVKEMRRQLDDVKVRGKDIPKPVKNWYQCGLSQRVLDALKKGGFSNPMPIQAQALPIIMSGRDCIGIAKTGSGKTLAFVLPMLRHIKDQPPIGQGDGPIALIMAPTRELVQQIGKDVKRFAKPLGITCVCVYGGSQVSNQITELKRGCEVVVCTPGRMIDILVTSAGKITNMRRVTYLVLDEADRMFDMGFEPQIMRIVNNIRPDRQTVMFSATFPRSVEVLARQVLESPVEIQVGGRSVVNKDITQVVEIRPEEDRFLRLLEILGEWYERGKVLIFVNSQESCDTLFRDLLKVGYPCLSLHGGKDQSDRESTITDFKMDVCNLLVATSVAARGLDVKELVLVVNYNVPDHHEDYVHRVGRTGRAGNKGTAITFIGPDEDGYAPDLVKALKESGAPVPKDLQAMADAFTVKRKAGTAQAHGSGFGGSGFKFDRAEEDQRKTERKQAAKEYGAASESDSEDDDDVKLAPNQAPGAAAPQQQPELPANLPPEAIARIRAAQAKAAQMTLGAQKPNSGPGTYGPLRTGIHAVGGPMSTQIGTSTPYYGAPAAPIPMPTQAPAVSQLVLQAQAVASKIAAQAGLPQLAAQPAVNPAARAQAIASQWAPPGAAQGEAADQGIHYEAELEINDFPQHARWKVTHKDAMAAITELTGAAVTTRGVFVAPGRQPPEGERKLFLLIEGPTEGSVRKAKQEIKRILEETTEKVMRRDAPQPGRYSVM